VNGHGSRTGRRGGYQRRQARKNAEAAEIRERAAEGFFGSPGGGSISRGGCLRGDVGHPQTPPPARWNLAPNGVPKWSLGTREIGPRITRITRIDFAAEALIREIRVIRGPLFSTGKSSRICAILRDDGAERRSRYRSRNGILPLLGVRAGRGADEAGKPLLLPAPLPHLLPGETYARARTFRPWIFTAG
jgi:hypothetical protein